MFLIRTAFWLSLVILCLPIGGDDDNPSASAAGAVEAMSVARSAVGDLSKFCERNPGTCDTGNMVVSSFGQKARYGAQIVFQYLDNKFGSEDNSGPRKSVSMDNEVDGENS